MTEPSAKETENLIDTRDERRKDQEARIQHNEKIMNSIRRDQRKKEPK